MIARTMLCALVIACGDAEPSPDGPPPTDTNPADDPLLLPTDTSIFVPRDTGEPDVVDVVPDDFLYLRHFGQWELSGGFMTGSMTIREYVNFIDTADTIDTGPLPWVCDVQYSLTGERVDDATCPTCTDVFDVTHTVVSGSPAACQEPDVPADGVTWQLGYDAKNGRIFHNYYGTDVWVGWFFTETTPNPDVIAFEWEATLAVEIQDTAEEP